MPRASKALLGHPLKALLLVGIIIYLAWLPVQAGSQFLQFSINRVVIGAIYALMALGFTLVYGTVWFFDLSYGAMATIGGYSVFYFTSRQVQTIGRGEINSLPLNIIMGVLLAFGIASTEERLVYRSEFAGIFNGFPILVLLEDALQSEVESLGFFLGESVRLDLLVGGPDGEAVMEDTPADPNLPDVHRQDSCVRLFVVPDGCDVVSVEPDLVYLASAQQSGVPGCFGTDASSAIHWVLP